MGTRSRIALEKDNEITSIYCHWDGYPSYMGRLLKDVYNTEDKVQELISLGDASSLTDKLHPTGVHSFDAPEDGVSLFYGRDRDEPDVACYVSENEQRLLKLADDCGAEYVYLFRNGEWFCSSWRANCPTLYGWGLLRGSY